MKLNNTEKGLINGNYSSELQLNGLKEAMGSILDDPSVSQQVKDKFKEEYEQYLVDNKAVYIEIGYAFEKAAFGTIYTKSTSKKLKNKWSFKLHCQLSAQKGCRQRSRCYFL